MHRVVLLTNSSSVARYFANGISESLALHRIVLHRPQSRLTYSLRLQLRRLRRETLGRWLGGSPADADAGRIRRLERRLELEARSQFLRCQEWFRRFPAPTCSFRDINSEECVRYLRSLEPELLLIFGTPILRGTVLEIAHRGVLNTHTSILPHYRGTQVEFWQLYNRDHEHVGVTIHFAEPRVDRGDIVLQQRTQVQPEDTYFTLRYKNLNAAIALVPTAARSVLEGTAQRKPQPPLDVATFRSKMLTIEKKREFYVRRGLLTPR